MTTRHPIIVVAVLIFAGCNINATTPPSEADLWSLGDKKFGHNRFAVVTLPNSTGPLSDALVSGWSALLGPPALVRHTAARLKDVHAKNLNVLVSSPSPAYAQKVVAKALSTLPPRSLSGMKICVVGIEPEKLQQEGQRVGATLVK